MTKFKPLDTFLSCIILNVRADPIVELTAGIDHSELSRLLGKYVDKNG